LREGKAVRAPFFYAEQGGRGPSVALTPVSCGKGVGSSNGGGRGQSADMWLRHHRMSVSVPYSRRFRPTVGETFFCVTVLSLPADGGLGEKEISLSKFNYGAKLEDGY
jgi:hypothetical protein